MDDCFIAQISKVEIFQIIDCKLASFLCNYKVFKSFTLCIPL